MTKGAAPKTGMGQSSFICGLSTSAIKSIVSLETLGMACIYVYLGSCLCSFFPRGDAAISEFTTSVRSLSTFTLLLAMPCCRLIRADDLRKLNSPETNRESIDQSSLRRADESSCSNGCLPSRLPPSHQHQKSRCANISSSPSPPNLPNFLDDPNLCAPQGLHFYHHREHHQHISTSSISSFPGTNAAADIPSATARVHFPWVKSHR